MSLTSEVERAAEVTLHTMIFRCGWTPGGMPQHAAAPHGMFAEPSATSEVALAGRDGQRAADLLAASKRAGTDLLASITERAVRRLLSLAAATGAVPAAPVLFDDAELRELQDAFQATIATADLLGRSRVRRFAARHVEAASNTFAESDVVRAVYDFWFRSDGIAKTRATVETMVRRTMQDFGVSRFDAESLVRAAMSKSESVAKFADPPARPGRLGPDEDPFSHFPEPIPFQPPHEAVSYFNRLIPSIGTDPYRYGALLERHAFTLAAAADQALLDKVKQAIARKVKNVVADRLNGVIAAPIGTATADIQDILDAAGVAPANPQYAEMVFRTNMMDAYNAGQTAEMATPEMQEFFPVWRYEGILDSRTGDDHRPKIDRYYPSEAVFADVRGPRVWNCRCCQTPIYRTEWAELQAGGARLESSW